MSEKGWGGPRRGAGKKAADGEPDLIAIHKVRLQGWVVEEAEAHPDGLSVGLREMFRELEQLRRSNAPAPQTKGALWRRK